MPLFHNIILLFSCHLLYKLQPDFFLSVKNVSLCLQCDIHPRRGSGSLQEVTAGQWNITYCGSTTDISKVSVVTATGWTVRGSNPGGGEIFRTCPDRPWGQPSPLYNGYQVFPGGKVAGVWC